ncbi:MAG TPA: hypothetical protein VFJ58_11600 [Armatimonadota bacterium]|nr:hypothetical protein [Armatimonadota bacterium]
MNFPAGWNNPSHEQLPDLIGNNGGLTINSRRTVRKMLRALRSLREDADYRMGRTVDVESARTALLMASKFSNDWSWKMAITELTPMDVARRVKPYVARKRVGDITLRLDEARIRLQNGYWRIPVRHSREPEPLFPYYEALADLEQEVQDSEDIKVSIASGDPLTEE